MTLTPLHVAFVWVLKPHFRALSFAALTVGAMIPDIETIIAYSAGWSVFCSWEFTCTNAPDRLVLHSIIGALTVDVALAIFFVKVIERLLKIARLWTKPTGIKIDGNLYLSAAIGALSHVLIDWLHHPANPVFWPFMVNGSYYVDGLLHFMGVIPASSILAAVSIGIIIYKLASILKKNGYNFKLLISDPTKAIILITETLSRS